MDKTVYKKWYIWQLAHFLVSHKMKMSGEELAEHLNRNNIRTSYGTEYVGKRGTYTLIKSVWSWIYYDLGLEDEAAKVAKAFVKPGGDLAAKPTHITTKEALYKALKDKGCEHSVKTDGGQYVFLFDPKKQQSKGHSCAILYEFSYSNSPLALHLERLSADWLENLDPVLKKDPEHDPDTHGWTRYEVTDWAGLAYALELID